MSERAVITGVGVCSPLGESLPIFLRAILGRQCAAGPVRCFNASTFGAPFAAELDMRTDWVQETASHTGLDALALWLDRKLLFGLWALREALRGAFGNGARPRLGMSIGMGLEVLFLPDVVSLYDRQTGGFDLSRLPLINRKNPLRLPLHIISKELAKEAGALGACETFVSACAAGTQSLGEAALRVIFGGESCVVAGATDSMLNPIGVGCFRLLGALSSRASSDACRPFHTQRDGTIIGEGAAFFVVESLTTAKARGAKIIAEILGFGSSLDAYRVTSPSPDGAGARLAMRAALRQAKTPKIGYVNAHGTGTLQNDPVEIAAIHAELGRVPLSATKSQLGHAMAAAGALEIAASLACFIEGQCPPTLHLSQVDPACQADHIDTSRAFTGDAILKNSFGFGGQNASIVLGWPP
jgi:3-oxoacyl-[acyl-carrier-protein] synthase II